MKEKRIVFRRAVAAGVMIGVGAAVKLSCANEVVGSGFFSIGLFCICAFGLNLFTGKIGYVLDEKNYADIGVIWLGNLVGCSLSMGLLRFAKPALHSTAAGLMEGKFAQNLPAAMILAMFCGALMYLAVENYKRNPSGTGKIFGVVFCVTVFLLCGFEHSVADMCYAVLYVSSFWQGLQCLGFILAISVFNGVGSVLTRKLVR